MLSDFQVYFKEHQPISIYIQYFRNRFLRGNIELVLFY